MSNTDKRYKYAKKKILFLLILALLGQLQLNCQSNNVSIGQLEQDYFNDLYNFQFASANHKLKAKLPNNIYYLWRMYYQWWMLISTNDKSYFTHCFANIVLYESTPVPQDSLKIFFEAFRLRLLLLNHQYLKAYQQVNKLIDTLKVFSDPYSTKDNHKLIMGLLHYLGAKAYKKYPLLFHNKSFRQFSDTLGLNLLIQCTKSSSVFVRTEGLYFLTKIFLEMEEDYAQAYIYSSQLISLFPRNIIFGYHHLEILQHERKSQEAESYRTKLLAEIFTNKELIETQKKYLQQMLNSKI